MLSSKRTLEVRPIRVSLGLRSDGKAPRVIEDSVVSIPNPDGGEPDLFVVEKAKWEKVKIRAPKMGNTKEIWKVQIRLLAEGEEEGDPPKYDPDGEVVELVQSDGWPTDAGPLQVVGTMRRIFTDYKELEDKIEESESGKANDVSP